MGFWGVSERKMCCVWNLHACAHPMHTTHSSGRRHRRDPAQRKHPVKYVPGCADVCCRMLCLRQVVRMSAPRWVFGAGRAGLRRGLRQGAMWLCVCRRQDGFRRRARWLAPMFTPSCYVWVFGAGRAGLHLLVLPGASWRLLLLPSASWRLLAFWCFLAPRHFLLTPGVSRCFVAPSGASRRCFRENMRNCSVSLF